jgi:hypothetical protein
MPPYFFEWLLFGLYCSGAVGIIVWFKPFFWQQVSFFTALILVYWFCLGMDLFLKKDSWQGHNG